MPTDCIHETVLRDVVDILTDIKDYDEVQFLLNKKNGKSFKSAASATKDLILTFPVVCSSDISIENASMICKAIERKAVAMMQMLFSAISFSSSDNAIEYVKKLHTNINFGSDDISITSAIDTMVDVAEKLEAVGMAEIDQAVVEQVRLQLRNSNYFLPDSVSESSIGDYKIMPNVGNSGSMIIKEENDTTPAFAMANKLSSNISKTAKDISDIGKNDAEFVMKQILPSEVKKANELMPTLMIINFNHKVGEVVVTDQAVIGIKAKLYPVDSMDIINRIKSKTEDNNFLNKFVRATTNEISFFKDFLFAIDRAKLDALNYSSKNNSSKLWRILERRSKKSKIRRTMRMSNDASAISTLLVSQEVVEYLKKNENLDLDKPRLANSIMNSYNFMCVCICDDTMETAKFIYDTGEDIYETLSFTHLEREASDNAYKKVINLMTKIQR